MKLQVKNYVNLFRELQSRVNLNQVQLVKKLGTTPSRKSLATIALIGGLFAVITMETIGYSLSEKSKAQLT